MSTVNLKKCPRCGAIRDKKDLFCGDCGTPFGSSEENYRNLPLTPTVPVVPTERKSWKKNLLAASVVLVLLLIGTLFLGIQLGQSGKGSTQAITNTPPNPPHLTKTLSTVTVMPTPSPTPTFTPTPTPTPMQPGTVLYNEDGSDNWQGWLASGPDWTVQNGKLINTDGKGDPLIVPYNPGANGYNDYEVVAKITRVKFMSDYGGSFGIVVRNDGNGGGYTFSLCASLGYAFGGTWGCNMDYNTYTKSELLSGQQFPDGHPLKTAPFLSTAGSEYTYRIDVKGGTITTYINDNPILGTVTDYTYPSGGQVSIWDSGCQLVISNIEIILL